MVNIKKAVLKMGPALAVLVLVLAGGFAGYMVGAADQKERAVPVVLTSYSGTDIVEEEIYQMTGAGRVQMGTENDFVRDNNVTSYGVKIL
jgi:hypothetical protein